MNYKNLWGPMTYMLPSIYNKLPNNKFFKRPYLDRQKAVLGLYLAQNLSCKFNFMAVHNSSSSGSLFLKVTKS